jgi:hypothetical protein
LLAAVPTAEAYRTVLEPLLADGRLRRRLGEGGGRKAAGEHDIARAAAIMKEALDPIIGRAAAGREAAR